MVFAGELPGFEIRGEWRMRLTDFEAWLEGLATRGQRAPDAGPEAHHTSPSNRAGRTQESAVMTPAPELAVSHLTARISQTEMHERLVAALGKRVVRHGPTSAKPMEIDL